MHRCLLPWFLFARFEPEQFAGELFEDTLDKLYGPEDGDPYADPVAPEYTEDLDEASWIMMDAGHSDDQLSQSRLHNVHSALRLLRLAQRHRMLVARVSALAAICDHAASQVQACAAVQPAAEVLNTPAMATPRTSSQRAWWDSRALIAERWLDHYGPRAVDHLASDLLARLNRVPVEPPQPG